MPLQTGQTLVNRYRIVRLLGQGGFGAVYRAWDTNLKRPCAVKENLDVSPEAQRQFAREATVLANLSHPNLPRVTDHFTIPGQGQYLVMDFVEGEDLATMLQRQGALSLEQALQWISQVADALTYMHNRQPPVVHRDIKPANIRITPDGKAMLVDFGLVKLYDPGMQTTVGARAVTPGYAPPEQYGRGTTDTRSDIYALGATLYNLLTGQEPLESVQRLAGRQLPPAFQLNPAIPVHISQAIERAMHLEPEQRFQNAGEFLQALRTIEKTLVVGTGAPHRGSTIAVGTPPAAASPGEAIPFPGEVVAPRKSRPLAIGAGVGIALAICMLGALILGGGIYAAYHRSVQATEDAAFQATLQEKVRLTQTAQVQATQDYYATSTAVIFANMTSTAQAYEDYLNNLIASGTLVYGPENGDLNHDPESGLISSFSAGVDLMDFVVEVRFFNPFPTSQGSWDYGIGFRHAQKNDQYRLVVTSDGTWEIMNVIGDPNVDPFAQGDLANVNLAAGGSNLIRLMCKGAQGWFYLNGVLVAELDLSSRMFSGDIFIGTGFYQGDQQAGETTVFRDFTVWSLP